ncbi:MAG: SycD/LcrH family type III secretion system chaperone [Endozoicomonadaceae bacterium]|nr:SycD/LcrH family type III secretion system chaperone [Endozoicomonadaceae bacterium]
METVAQDVNSDSREEMLEEFVSRGGLFKDLKDMSDESMEAVYSVAYNLYEAGKYDDAIKVFQFLCFYDHLNKKYFIGLGACLRMQEKYDKAIKVFGCACALDTSDPQAVMYIGDCLLAAGDVEAAALAYEAAIEWAEDGDEWQDEIAHSESMLNSINKDSTEG